MKKILILLLLGLAFSYDSPQKGSAWEIDMYTEQINPLTGRDVWVNGLDNESGYLASTLNVNSINPFDSFSVMMSSTIPNEFPLDSHGNQALYYVLYYGFSTSNVLTITNPGVEYEPNKFVKYGQVPVGPESVLTVINNTAGDSYLWMSFVWRVSVERTQAAVKNKTAEIVIDIL